jgi:two-component system phosphate regulon sensor histidine kinase PhoR
VLRRGPLRLRTTLFVSSVLLLALSAGAAEVVLSPPLGAFLLGLSTAGLLASLVAPWISRPVEDLARIARRLGESGEAKADTAARAGAAPGGDVRNVARTLETLIVERTRVSETLRRERDLLSAILEGMREGVLLLDNGRKIVMTNARLREIFLSTPDVVGRTTVEAFRCPPLERAIDEAARERRESACEIEVAGLRPAVLHVRIAPISGAADSPLLAVFHDVTDLRRLETVRRDFVASASHELRTPVAAIRGAAEALEEPGLAPSEEARAFAGIIRRHAEQLTQLVGDLLDLSRIESGALALAPAEVDLGQEIRAAAADFEEIARSRSIRFDVEAARLPAPAVADRNALRQVLHNLIDNACKYGDEGAVVTLRAEAEAAPGGSEGAGESAGAWRAVVTVSDTGPGVEERHLARLFERFYRVDVTRSRALGGTGLGLSIVKHLVESMGGEVSATSVVGRGSSFRFTLPLAPPRT